MQEEAWNMGAWTFISQHLPPLLGDRSIRYAGRDEAASPAIGSYKLHQAEQADVVEQALGSKTR